VATPLVNWNLVQNDEKTVLENMVAFLLDYPGEDVSLATNANSSAWYNCSRRLQTREYFDGKKKNVNSLDEILPIVRKMMKNCKLVNFS